VPVHVAKLPGRRRVSSKRLSASVADLNPLSTVTLRRRHWRNFVVRGQYCHWSKPDVSGSVDLVDLQTLASVVAIMLTPFGLSRAATLASRRWRALPNYREDRPTTASVVARFFGEPLDSSRFHE
jgi:hypothetical protein